MPAFGVQPFWGGGLTIQNQWASVGAVGYAVRHLIIQTATISCNLMNVGIIYERGRSFDPRQHPDLRP